MKNTCFALILSLTWIAPASADLALAKSRHCMGCHASDRKLVGPAFRDVARRYAGDSSAQDRLAAKIVRGGVGSWGAVPMPANPQVSQDEARTLAAWVLTHR